jgi:hypothetical protein
MARSMAIDIAGDVGDKSVMDAALIAAQAVVNFGLVSSG